jgi:hypothetical protein
VQENYSCLRASRSLNFLRQNRTGSLQERLSPSSSDTATGGIFVVGSLTVLNSGESMLSTSVHPVLTSLHIISQFPPPFNFTTITTYVLYSPNSTINKFFNSNITITRQQCHEFAISRAGGVSTTLQIQGVSSYTVTAGPNKFKFFQFRDENSQQVQALPVPR